MFNALKYTQELEKAGFSRDQSETSIKLLIEIMNENFATKSDFKELSFKFDSMAKELEYKLTIKLGTLLTIAVGVTAALVRILSAIQR